MHGKKITVLDPKSSIQKEIQYLKDNGIKFKYSISDADYSKLVSDTNLTLSLILGSLILTNLISLLFNLNPVS